MTARSSAPATIAAGAVTALAAGGIGLSLLAQTLDVADLGWLIGQTAFAAVGALILVRQPGNTVGRIMAASGLIALTQSLLWRYAEYASTGVALPLVVPAAWLAGWIFVPMFALFIVLLPLYFPGGRLPSPRWRPVLWATAALTALMSFYLATAPGPLEDLPVDNPMVLPITRRMTSVMDRIGGDESMIVAFLLLGIAAWGSLVLRYRRSAGTERLQLKWFVWSVGMFLAYMLVSAVIVEGLLGVQASTAVDLIGLAMMLGVPVSIGVAVLRYRLFEIDRIVSRTLAYAALTLLLAGIYLGAVTTLTALTAPLTGESPIAVAAATLLAAAAFGPARRRIQAAVDRRFNRSRYDAQQTVEGFAARMRDQVDIDDLSAELRFVATQALQPTSAALWLRPEGR
ncbi:MAG TPA: hypothetical protein VM307_10535 [Egibacteraceae bacterium]|nr:hypothetical protein [Egibacteraceae bacterium]